MKDDVYFHKASVRSFTKNKQDTKVYIIYQLFLSFPISFKENWSIQTAGTSDLDLKISLHTSSALWHYLNGMNGLPSMTNTDLETEHTDEWQACLY